MTKSFKHLVERYMSGVGFDLEDADAVQREIDDMPGIVCSELRVNRKNLHVEILSRQFQITQKFEKSTIPFPLEGRGSSVNIHMAPNLESLKNLPTECKSLVIFDCPKIKTFRDLPEKVELLSIMLHDHQVLDHLPEGLSDSLDLTLSDLSQIRCKIPNSVKRLFLHGLHSCRGICEKFDNPKSLELFINIDGRDKEGCRDILRIKNLKKICPSDHSQVSPDIYKMINAQLSKPTQ